MTNPSSNDTAAPTAPSANLTGSPKDASFTSAVAPESELAPELARLTCASRH